MLLRARTLSAVAAASAVLLAGTSAASAACKRFGFSVNDYGKEGPTKDAKDLLDKHIAQWAAERGIKKYTTGKKEVTCELFLDLILFDEHTCKAVATVCWDGPEPKATQAAAPPADGQAPAAPKATKKAATPKSTGITTGAVPPSTAAPSAAPAKAPVAPAKAPAAAKAAAPVVAPVVAPAAVVAPPAVVPAAAAPAAVVPAAPAPAPAPAAVPQAPVPMPAPGAPQQQTQ
jgi:hypothetical protein